jgi:FecR protein
MLRIRFALAAVALCSGVFVQQSVAGPLTSAEVTKIINRVSVIEPAKGDRPAVLRDIIKDNLGLQTGSKSRSELLFQDNTLTRLGAETFFSFKTGTRDLTLEKGSMLLQVPKGLGGAKIHTAAVTAAITGTTIMMEYSPGKYLKVLVLEGSLRLSRNGSFGDSAVLRPGKMVIMRPDAKTIPEPIDVNLAEIVKTSTLVNFPGSKILPSMPLIQAAINNQGRELTKGRLVPTNLVIGHGTTMVLASKNQLSKTIGSLNGLAGSYNGAPVSAIASSTAANNVLGSGPAVSVSSSAELASLLGNAAPGSGGAINVTPATVNAGGNVAVSANTGGVSVKAGANVSLGGNGR